MIRPKISIPKVRFFLRQQYGFKNMEAFFEYSELAPKTHHEAIAKTIAQFTGYKLVDGKLRTFNPYTSKYESLQIKGFGHIRSRKDLMTELSMLHRTRMDMLEQSRKRILELSKTKKNTRDRDLGEHPKMDRAKRLEELDKRDRSDHQELER